MDVEVVCVKNESVEIPDNAETNMIPPECFSPPLLPSVLMGSFLKTDPEKTGPIICSVQSMAKELPPPSLTQLEEEAYSQCSWPGPTDVLESRMSCPVDTPGDTVITKRKRRRKERTKAQYVTGTHLSGIKVKTEVVDLEQPSTSTAMSHLVVKREPESEDSAAPSSTSVQYPQGGEMGAVQQLLTTLQKPVDVDQVFGDYIACELRALRNQEVKRRLKRTITRALLDASGDDI